MRAVILTVSVLLVGVLSASSAMAKDTAFNSDKACFVAKNPEMITVKRDSDKAVPEKAKQASLMLYTAVSDYMSEQGPYHRESKMARVSFLTKSGYKGVAEGFGGDAADTATKYSVDCDGGSMNIVRDPATGTATVTSNYIRTLSDCNLAGELSTVGATFTIVPCK